MSVSDSVGRRQDQDCSSRTKYNIFRWYRAGWGRYTQADPVGIGGRGVDLPGRGWEMWSQRQMERNRRMGLSGATAQTLYAYVDDNPQRATDPLGLWVEWDCLATRTTPYSTSRPRNPQNIRDGIDYVCAYEVRCEGYEPFLTMIVRIEGFWIRYMNTQRPCTCDAYCSFSLFGVPQTVMGRNMFEPTSPVVCGATPSLAGGRGVI